MNKVFSYKNNFIGDLYVHFKKKLINPYFIINLAVKPHPVKIFS